MRAATVAATLLALSVSAPAWAGGLGLMLTGGAHTERLWYYNKTNEAGGEYLDWREYDQAVANQLIGNGGVGLEVILGNRDERLYGFARGFWLRDLAQRDPADGGEFAAEDTVSTFRSKPRDVGTALVGVTWGFVGDPQNFMFGATAHIGAGFLTTDRTEFLLTEIGPAVSYRISQPLQIYGEAVYSMRFRKRAYHSGNVNIGIRYLFD